MKMRELMIILSLFMIKTISAKVRNLNFYILYPVEYTFLHNFFLHVSSIAKPFMMKFYLRL